MGLSEAAIIIAERISKRGHVAIASCCFAFIVTMIAETRLGAASATAVVAFSVALFSNDDDTPSAQGAVTCN